MEIARVWSAKRIEDDLQKFVNENRRQVDLQPERKEGGRPQNFINARKRQVYAIRDSQPRRTDRTVARTDLENKRLRCLIGAKIQDVDLRLTRILIGMRKNPLTVIQVGTNDTSRFSLRRFKEDYARLGKVLKEMEAQVILSGILPVPRGE